jgi:hypothetical protein
MSTSKDNTKNQNSKLFIQIAEETFYEWKRLLNVKYLYYYCSTDVFLNGIVVNNPSPQKELCLWASRYSYMNDKEELQCGIRRIESWNPPNYLVEGIKQAHQTDHIISLSMAEDSLTMWNTYGDGGKGVMLVFDTKLFLSQYAGRLQPCFYSDSEYDINIETSFGPIIQGSMFNGLSLVDYMGILIPLLLMYAILRKDKNYDYEKEVRIYGIGNRYFDKEEREVLYRYSKGLVVPYVKEYFPQKVLKEVRFGPVAEHELSEISMREFLHAKGFIDCKVTHSNIPYRG